jgi:hypothetical protein
MPLLFTKWRQQKQLCRMKQEKKEMEKEKEEKK